MTAPPKSIFCIQNGDGSGDLYSRILPGAGMVALAWPDYAHADSALDIHSNEVIVEYRPVKTRRKKNV